MELLFGSPCAQILFGNLKVKRKHLLKQFKRKCSGFSANMTPKSEFVSDEPNIRFGSVPLCFPDRAGKELGNVILIFEILVFR